MKSKDLQPLKVSLHGMNERMHKMMVNYLKLLCKGTAIVVNDDEAHAEIVDVDLSPSESLLEERLAQQPPKPIIALSLDEISTSGVIYVKKPIEVPEVLAAFAVAKDVILGKTSLERIAKPTDKTSTTSSAQDKTKAQTKPKPQSESTKHAPDAITQALIKSETTGKLTGQQKFIHNILHNKVAFNDTKQQTEKAPPRKKSDLQDLQNVPSIEQPIPEKPIEKRQTPLKTAKSSTAKPKSKLVKDKSEITQTNLETKVPEETKKTYSPEKVEPLRPEAETFQQQKTATQDEIVQTDTSPEFLKPDELPVKSAPIDDIRETKKPFEKTTHPSSKSEKKPSADQSVTLKQPAVEQPISTNKASVAKPDQDLQYTKEKTTPASADKFATTGSFTSFLDVLWDRKSLIIGLTCLFTLIAGIYIFQLTPLYETRARIFITTSNAENSDVNSTSTKDTLDKATANKIINEIASRQLARRVINNLHLNTIPEFFAASSLDSGAQASTSKLRLERQAAEQISSMTDYFLQNLKVSQFKNSPIINIDYKAEDPGLATKIVNQLVEEYLAMQKEKKAEVEQQLIDWETNKLPAARDQVEQSQNALELYVEMNKWSQFEQQFAEDMGVNSEIRALEKKLKADIALYEILVERFEKYKQDTDSIEAKLISGAELPLYPSYPNKLRLLLSTLLSAILISILIAYILSALNFGGKKIIGELSELN